MTSDCFKINFSFESDEEKIFFPYMDQNKADVEADFDLLKDNLDSIGEESNDYHSRYFFSEKKEETNPRSGNTNSSTKDKSIIRIKSPKRKKELFFLIKKVNRKLGRLSKNSKKYNTMHDKFFQDNIIQKIKVNFHASIYNYVNLLYHYYLENKNMTKNEKKLIKKISPKIYNSIKLEDNLIWFSSKLKDILSSEISSKYKTIDKADNKKSIEFLYLQNDAKNVINFLEKTIDEIYFIYCNNLDLEGFKTLKDDLLDLRKKMEQKGEKQADIQNYLVKYEKIAVSLKSIFSEKRIIKKSL